MVTSLIVSVGGTEAPVVKTISEHKPKYICFLCSQKSVELIPNIRKLLAEKLGEEMPNFIDHKIILDDENDLIHCYQKARECVNQLTVWGVAGADTIVDYTGGTKSMSVAIALATVKEGYEFSYIGGERRTKDGLGIVVDGSEVVRAGINPWSLFAVDERRLIIKYFNRYQYIAAKEICDMLVAKQELEKGLEQYFKIVSQLCAIYDQWDKFQHSEAIKLFKPAIEQLTTFVSFNSQVKYQQLLASVQNNFERLKQIAEDTKQFKKPSRSLIIDLIANAERRAVENKYDDAVARIYRALEMVAQCAITEHPLSVSSASDFPSDKIPELLREEYVRLYSRDGKIKLGSEALFRVLDKIEPPHPHARVFWNHYNSLRNVQNARNQSILAHGITPVKAETYETLRATLCERMALGDLVEFTKLPEE
jgi:CRISPR-associated protein (TIGR02710 family)